MSPVGKAEIKTVIVPRGVTVALLVVITALIALSVYLLSGHATMHGRFGLADLLSLVRRYDSGSIANVTLLSDVAPAAADVLLFIPWGAVAFLAFDRGESRRAGTYALTLVVGVAFALALVEWQNRLPTRVTGWYDALWNCAGCAAGAILGHLRKRVRIRFQ